MNDVQKSFSLGLWAVLVVGMLGLIGAGLLATRSQGRDSAAAPKAVEQSEELTTYFEAPTFELINQNGATVRSQDLRGNIWVAAFVFTHCKGPCPMMTGKLAKLQKLVPDPKIKLVSFSVDPGRDTPDALKTYADRLGADHSKWYFLTGTKAAADAVSAGFKLALVRGENPDEIIHGEKFLLVDSQGQVRGIYSSGLEEDLQRLTRDANTLASKIP